MRAILGLLVLLFAAACQPANTPAQHSDAPAPAEASSVTSNGITLSNGWASLTPGGVDVSAGYIDIANTGTTPDRLLSASSPRASHVSLHEMAMDGAVMQMRAISALDLPVGATVSLAPGGNHLMFEGVTAPFTEGDVIPVTLHFEHAGDINVNLPARRQPAHGE